MKLPTGFFWNERKLVAYIFWACWVVVVVEGEEEEEEEEEKQGEERKKQIKPSTAQHSRGARWSFFLGTHGFKHLNILIRC